MTEIKNKHLFLNKIEEPEENSVLFIIHPAEYDIKKSDAIISGNILIKGTEYWADTSKIIEIYFEEYVGYSIRNESYTFFDETEIRLNKNGIIEFESSNYLAFIEKSTHAKEIIDGELKHYGIYCENHTIDIISNKKPKINEKSV